MKKPIYAFVLCVIATVLASCGIGQTGQEGKLIGKWHYFNADATDTDTLPVETGDGGKVQTFVEFYETYKPEGVLEKQGIVTYKYTVNDENTITLKYKIAYIGKWNVSGDTLYLKPADTRIDFASMEISDPSKSKLKRRANVFRLNQDKFMQGMKNGMLIPTNKRFVRLDDNKLILDSDKLTRVE